MYSMMLTYQQPIYHDLDSWYSFLLDNKLYKIKKITGKAIIQYYAYPRLNINIYEPPMHMPTMTVATCWKHLSSFPITSKEE